MGQGALDKGTAPPELSVLPMTKVLPKERTAQRSKTKTLIQGYLVSELRDFNPCLSDPKVLDPEVSRAEHGTPHGTR